MDSSTTNVVEIAKVCHDANRSYCQLQGDHSQLPWEDAPEWQKESAIKGVINIIDNFPNCAPEDSHVNWLKDKEADGWVYGPVKDPEKKEHPCMVPYNELPMKQRMKDYIFFGIVAAFITANSLEE